MSKAYIQSEQVRHIQYEIDLYRLALELAAKDGHCPDYFNCKKRIGHKTTCSEQEFEKCLFNSYLKDAAINLKPYPSRRLRVDINNFLKSSDDHDKNKAIDDCPSEQEEWETSNFFKESEGPQCQQ